FQTYHFIFDENKKDEEEEQDIGNDFLKHIISADEAIVKRAKIDKKRKFLDNPFYTKRIEKALNNINNKKKSFECCWKSCNIFIYGAAHQEFLNLLDRREYKKALTIINSKQGQFFYKPKRNIYHWHPEIKYNKSKFTISNYKDFEDKKTDIIVYHSIVEKLKYVNSSNKEIIIIDYKQYDYNNTKTKLSKKQNFLDSIEAKSSKKPKINNSESELANNKLENEEYNSELSGHNTDNSEYVYEKKEQLEFKEAAYKKQKLNEIDKEQQQIIANYNKLNNRKRSFNSEYLVNENDLVENNILDISKNSNKKQKLDQNNPIYKGIK
ncbi:6463_t:CDS:2, partial [Gigaspora margarita]